MNSVFEVETSTLDICENGCFSEESDCSVGRPLLCENLVVLIIIASSPHSNYHRKNRGFVEKTFPNRKKRGAHLPLHVLLGLGTYKEVNKAHVTA